MQCPYQVPSRLKRASGSSAEGLCNCGTRHDGPGARLYRAVSPQSFSRSTPWGPRRDHFVDNRHSGRAYDVDNPLEPWWERVSPTLAGLAGKFILDPSV